ncbi:MAG TPA: carbon-nitrogen family hydrolase [Tepidisphaeraceae bacterium]|nr:carbon-nitrogen family hydrolase [Tepidisphaeraceae bacterium]
MKIALAQLICKLGDVESNIASMERLARLAHADGADVVVFPEMADTGYQMDAIVRAAGGADGLARRRLGALAKSLSMWVIAGLSLRERDTIYNTAVVFDRHGEVQAEYRKIHLFSGLPDPEHRVMTAGSEHCVFDLEGVPTGLMICYDLRFPELARALTLAGAEMLIIPAAWPEVRVAHWNALLIARAIENQLFVVGVNRGGNDGTHPHGGYSVAIDPMGTIIYLNSSSEEFLYVANLDCKMVQDVRQRLKFLGDRRPELYRS